MNKHIVVFLVLGLVGYYGFKGLNKAYKKVQTPAEVVREFTGTAEFSNSLMKDPNRPEVFYRVVVDRFADGDSSNNKDVDLANPLAFHGGDLKGLAQNLDQLEDLGATALILNPIVKQVAKRGVYKSKDLEAEYEIFPFAGEMPDNIEEIDPRYGSAKDLVDLVAKSRQKNLKVIVTLDLNSTPKESSFFASHHHFFRPSPKGKCDLSKVLISRCELKGAPDFMHESEEVQNYLIETLTEKWAKLGIDGFLFENARGYDIGFLKKLQDRLKQNLNREFIFMSQIHNYKDPDLKDFKEDHHYNYNERFSSSIRMLANQSFGVDNAHRYFSRSFFDRYIRPEKIATSMNSLMKPSLLYSFFENENLAKLAFTLHIALGANPVIEFGEEFGKIDSSYPYIASDYPWEGHDISPGRFGERNQNIYAHYKKLIALYKKSHKFLQGEYAAFITPEASGLFCFQKMKDQPDKKLSYPNSLSCFNFNNEKKSYDFVFGNIWNSRSGVKTVTELLSGKNLPVSDKAVKMEIAPYEALILAPQ